VKRIAHGLGRAVLVVLVLLGALGRRRREPPRPDHAAAERLVAVLLAGVSLGALGFVVLFAFDADTQLLGLSLGASLALLAGALAVAGKRLVAQDTKVEERPIYGNHEDVEASVAQLREISDGISRRKLLGRAAAAAGLSLGSIAVVPLLALGPRIDSLLRRTPWHAGRRLVDINGHPIAAAAIAIGGFETAFPEGADQDNLTAPIIVVRVPPASLRMPLARRHWTPDGLVAYSKICTHAACAVSLFRSPLSPSTDPNPPALVCPCHYSTFDVLDGGSVEFGPAGRPLPQLPLKIDSSGLLRAAGPLSGPVGPAWWGVS
jgi:ubiquinol-cytochrome c reductase iron-sulfur subunit